MAVSQTFKGRTFLNVAGRTFITVVSVTSLSFIIVPVILAK